MKTNKAITITISQDSVERLEKITGIFGGKVATFAGRWTDKLATLTAEQLRHLEEEVDAIDRANRAQMRLKDLS